jgi:peptidoglycan/xylan/chitin deacetylase (PgdA/CDA1 family)
MLIHAEPQAPVLLYHALFEGNSNPENYAITVNEFERHVRYLSENGFMGACFEDFLDGRENDHSRKYVLISFDDGNESDYSVAFPLLKQYGMRATFFVTVNRIGTAGYLDWQQLREMADGGMSIQSHSLNHVFLSDLSAEGLQTELHESKRTLEKQLSRPVDFISLPGGFCSRKVLRAAQEAGYKGVATSCPGLNCFGNSTGRLLVFNRFVITRSTPIYCFQKIVNADWMHASKSRMKYTIKASAKKILGSALYYRIWSMFFKYKK